MALTAPIVTSAILASSVYPSSQTLPRVATAVGTSLAIWLPSLSNALALGNPVGLAGVGFSRGKMFFRPQGQVATAFRSFNIQGVAAAGIAASIDTGVALALNSSAEFRGVSIGVGSGVDLVRVLYAVVPTLTVTLQAQLRGVVVAGVTSDLLASAISTGIAGIIQTGFGFGAVTGPAAPVGATGRSVVSLF